MYLKENKKDQTSEETKLDLQSQLHPQRMKLQINSVSKIRNGGTALEVPADRVEGLEQTLQQVFETIQAKINGITYEEFKEHLVALFGSYYLFLHASKQLPPGFLR